MTKVKNTKQVSRLTGALLARKGTAIPAHTSLSMNKQVLDRFSATKDGVEEAVKDAGGEIENNILLENAIEIVNGQIKNRQSMEQIGNISQKSELHTKPDIKAKAKVSVTQTNSHKSSVETETNKRIAMTLRMEEESHLRLRIFSAHTRKSCQAILCEALDLYFEKNSEKPSLQNMTSQHR